VPDDPTRIDAPRRPSAGARLARALLPLAAALGLALMASGPSRAADAPAGADDPAFAAALTLWLADDDETALPEFARLAARENDAARLLLARIDATPALQGPWLASLPRAERIALLREPGGRSGRSWIEAASRRSELARLWRDLPQATPATALRFAAIGEPRAARETLAALAARQYVGFVAVADDPAFPAEMRHLIWRELAATPEGRARIDTEIAARPAGDPTIARFRADPAASPAAQDAWLAEAPLAAPLRALCAAACPATPASCVRGALALVGGHAGLARQGSPVETLVPGGVWDASPRGRAALLRRPEARTRTGAWLRAAVAAEDACLAAALDAETARFAR
jgi:hypothetical protein